MKLYIDHPEDMGDGLYELISETGELLAQHYCSNSEYAKYDLVFRNIIQLTEQFGQFKVLFLGQDDMTAEKLMELNKQIEEDNNAQLLY